MCSIAGFLSLGQNLPEESKALLRSMNQLMQHRGPDGQEIFISQKNNLGMGHCRLAIIDPTPEGEQPFFSADKSIILVFNGEIYNYKQLRIELEDCGRIFRTKTDTEVIVQAYQEWGISCLDRFFGMFAIGLFDSNTQEFFLVRDRIGIKPIYFSQQGGFLSFASETNPLKLLPWIKNELNPVAIYHYLTFMSCPAPYTTIEGIYKLPAGYFLKVDKSKTISFNQWYCPIKATKLNVSANKNIDANEAEKKLLELLKRSVARRMVSDVPVAVFLSGGLDSSLITALAAQTTDRLSTFNISFQGDPASDEKLWARKISKIFGTNHYEIEIKPSEVKNLIKNMIDSCDQPLADCVNVPFFALSEQCKKRGFKVALVGEGADELFFGYPEYAKYSNLETALSKGILRLAPSWSKKFLAHLAFKSGQKPSVITFFENWRQNRPIFWGAAIAFTEHEKANFKRNIEQTFRADELILKIFPELDQRLDSYSIVKFYNKQINKQFPNADFAQQIAFLELKNRIPELLLARADSMGMANGLEARVPFLDHEVIEFALALPKNLRCSKNKLKPLLKSVAELILPKEFVNRPKVGFSAPIKSWLDKSFLQSKEINNFISAKKTFYSNLPVATKNPLKQWVLRHLNSKWL